MTEILCITYKYPPNIGGMEKQSYELIHGLSYYYTTHVIAYKQESHIVAWFLSLRSKVIKMLKDHPNIKLIHLNDGSMGVISLWLQKYTKIPIVITIHGLDIVYPLGFFQHKLVPRLTKYTASISVSESTKNECVKRGLPEDSTFVVRNGVDCSMASVPFDQTIYERMKNKYGIDVTGKHILVSTGRPVKRKGFSWFLKNVMPLLNKDIIFLMIGPLKNDPNALEKTMRGLENSLHQNVQLMLGMSTDATNVAHELKLQENAYHLGKIKYDDLLQVLSLADLFVMPNLHFDGDIEGFGLVALEASMRGTYVLASGIEGITDAVIDGENGYLLPSGNAQAWADKIHELLSDKELLNTLSEKGRKYTMEHYSWAKMVNGYKEVFDKYIM